MKCFVLFRLAPGVTPDDYDAWFRAENVPAVRRMSSISGYRVWRVREVIEGKASFDVLEEMEIDDQSAFERELDELPEMGAMLGRWRERVVDQVVLYADEIAQDES